MCGVHSVHVAHCSTVSRFHLDLIDSSRLASQPASPRDPPVSPSLPLEFQELQLCTTMLGVCSGGTDVNPREHSSGAICFVFCFVLFCFLFKTSHWDLGPVVSPRYPSISVFPA